MKKNGDQKGSRHPMLSPTTPLQKDSRHPMLSAVSPVRMKVVTAEEAIQLIQDGDTIATGGFVGSGFPEEIAIKIEEYFITHGRPRDLTVVYAAGQGDGSARGLNHLGHEGLLKRIIGGHWGLVPKLQKLALDNKVQAYNFPQGVISHMFRDIAAHKPVTITDVGIMTYVDPRYGGGKINESTTEDLIELMNIRGKDYLAYKTFPINVAIIRGTTSDTDGNITMEKEALTNENLSIAMAAKNSNGFVIAQVERIAEKGTLNARQVKIPGILVDCVVVSTPDHHWQTFGVQYNPSFSCETKVPVQSIPPMEMSPRKIVVRRTSFELKGNRIVNLGIGMPEGVSSIANEEQISDLMTLTAEPGIIGGLPAGGLSFGAATNAEAVIDQPYQFDFYDGGGLDIAFLGLAEADKEGNVNVSKFGPKMAGCGGFINISQKAKKVAFIGTFTAGGLKISVHDGQLKIDQEGSFKKFKQQVEHVTFSGRYARSMQQPVLYITERCVIALTSQGMELIEIAPGVDLEKDILAHMEFEPIIKGTPRLMDKRIFLLQPMGLRDDFLRVPLEERLIYDPVDNIFFVNFEGYSVNTIEDVLEIEAMVRKILSPVGKKVYTIVNYDNFTLNPNILDEYTDMVKRVVSELYSDVTRYSSSAFLRMRLGEALKKRKMPPHLYESLKEAEKALKKNEDS